MSDDVIQFKLQNLNPKKNPVSYNIETLQDIADCITNENYEGFLVDFEACLLSVLLMKSTIKGLVDEGKIPDDTKVEFPKFTWIDDWKPKRKRKNKTNG